MITVFGSVNLDIVMPVEDLPRPGETVLSEQYMMMPGGKGANQAYAASQAGDQVAMFGCVGQDSFADEALRLLQENEVDLTGICRGQSPTGCASIWVDSSGENEIVVASGANWDLTADQVPDDMLGPDSILLLQMEVNLEENWKLVKRAKELGSRVMLNVAPAGPVPEEVLEDLDFLIVNELEGQQVARSVYLDEAVPTKLPRLLHNKYGLTCILTLGGAGSLCFGPEGGWSVPSLPVNPVDSTGAGDAFVGTFAACLDGNMPMEDALRQGTVAAGLCCTEKGSQETIPTAEEVQARLADLTPSRKLV